MTEEIGHTETSIISSYTATLLHKVDFGMDKADPDHRRTEHFWTRLKSLVHIRKTTSLNDLYHFCQEDG